MSLAKRVVWIFAAIVVVVVGVLIYQARCWIFPLAIDARLESGRENCTIIELGELSVRQKMSSPDAASYDSIMTYRKDSQLDSIVLVLGLVNPTGGAPENLDFFRIHFDQPGRAEGLRPEGFPGFQLPGFPLDIGGREVGWMEFFRVHHWHPLQWLDPSYGQRTVFHDTKASGRDYAYESSSTGNGYEFAVYSPKEDFVTVATSDRRQDCASFLEVFRRRDHQRVAKIRIDSCDYEANYILQNFGWISDRDFLYVTGFRGSECFVCRFDK